MDFLSLGLVYWGYGLFDNIDFDPFYRHYLDLLRQPISPYDP